MFSVEHIGRALVIAPQCDLDVYTHEALDKALSAAADSDAPRVVISLFECPYADSTALGAIAKAKTLMRERLVLAAPPGSAVMRVFSITSFDRIVPIFASVEAALEDAEFPRFEAASA